MNEWEDCAWSPPFRLFLRARNRFLVPRAVWEREDVHTKLVLCQPWEAERTWESEPPTEVSAQRENAILA